MTSGVNLPFPDVDTFIFQMHMSVCTGVTPGFNPGVTYQFMSLTSLSPETTVQKLYIKNFSVD